MVRTKPKKKVLITGASGFLGENLCTNLLDKDFKIVALTRKPQNVLNKNKNYSNKVISSINEKTDFRKVLENVDCIIHCIALTHLKSNSEKNSLNHFRSINVNLTLNLARQSIEKGVKRFIFISSIKVNGESTLINKPFNNNSESNPEDNYGKTKLEAELALTKLFKNCSSELVIIRPPLIYGRNPKGNLKTLKKLVKSGLPLPLKNINNKRSLISLSNISSLIIICIDHKNAPGNIFLASDGNDLSISQILIEMYNSIKKKPRLFAIPIPLLLFFIRIVLNKKKVSKIFGNLQIDPKYTIDKLNWEPDKNGFYDFISMMR